MWASVSHGAALGVGSPQGMMMYGRPQYALALPHNMMPQPGYPHGPMMMYQAPPPGGPGSPGACPRKGLPALLTSLSVLSPHVKGIGYLRWWLDAKGESWFAVKQA